MVKLLSRGILYKHPLEAQSLSAPPGPPHTEEEERIKAETEAVLIAAEEDSVIADRMASLQARDEECGKAEAAAALTTADEIENEYSPNWSATSQVRVKSTESREGGDAVVHGGETSKDKPTTGEEGINQMLESAFAGTDGAEIDEIIAQLNALPLSAEI